MSRQVTLIIALLQTSSVLPGDAAIAGRVTDRDSQRPLVGVLVQLASADLRRLLIAQTDGDGRYAFEDIAPGDYRVTAKHDRYIDQAYGVPDARMGVVSPEAVIHVAAKARAQIDLALVRMASISGRVLAQDGAPLSKAAVSLTMITDRGIRVSGRWLGQTDQRGEYIISGVPEGTYQVSALWTDPDTSPAQNAVQRRQIFHPGTESAEQAATISVDAGQTIEKIDIVMPDSELLRLKGKVIRSGASGTVEAYLVGASSVQNVAVSADGTFATPRVTAGRYTLVVRTKDAEISEATWLTVDLSVELIDLVLGLAPTGTIAGRVVSDDGSPLPETLQVAAVLADRGSEIDLLMRDRVDLADGGTFELRELFGERILRIVGGTEGWAIERVVQGKTPVTSLKVEAGSRIDDVTIVITQQPITSRRSFPLGPHPPRRVPRWCD